LKRSDFQKGVIDTVTSADQIIVLDSDGSIEPQIIDFAKVVTSNPFTGAFWPNSSTALTGADLANSDRIPVLDGTVPKYIEADQLAQGSQFSSRYQPTSNDQLFVPATDFRAAGAGSPTLSGIGLYQTPAWLFDASSGEDISSPIELPSWWTTFDAYLYWCNAGAGSGDIRTNVIVQQTANDGDLITGGTFSAQSTLTAGALGILKISKLNSSACTRSNGLAVVYFERLAANAADTLTNDCAVLGIELRRVS
jgi:hypothetical protein